MLFSRNRIRIESRSSQKEISLPRGMRGVKLRVQGSGNTVRLASPCIPRHHLRLRQGQHD